MTLLIIRVRLLLYLGVFALDLVGVYLRHLRPLIWSFLVLVIMLVGLAHSVFSTFTQVKLEQISSVALAEKIPHQTESFTRSQLGQRLTEYQAILRIQPQHTDVLINISLLEKALRNQKASYLAWEEARQLDPNNTTFTTQQ